MSIGNPPQRLSFLPQWPKNNTYVYNAQDPKCAPGTPQALCLTYRGGFYDRTASSTQQASNANASGGDPFDQIQAREGWSTANNPNIAQWSTDDFQLNQNTTMSRFPLGVLQVDSGEVQYAPQHILGLGRNSTILSALKSARRIASRSWGMYYGKIGVTPAGQLDGSFVIGGYDRAKTQGRGATSALGEVGRCPSEMIVTISGLLLNFPNGTDVDTFAGSSRAFQACIVPNFPLLMTMPSDFFASLDRLWGSSTNGQRSTGVNFWGAAYDPEQGLPYYGDLTLQVSTGGQTLPIRIPNDQLFMPDVTYADNGGLAVNYSRQIAMINPLYPPNDRDLAILGRNFLTSAYVMSNEDTRTFTLWTANATSESDPIAIDEDGKEVNQTCSTSDESISTNTTNPALPSTRPSEAGQTTQGSPEAQQLSTGAIVGIAVGAASGVLLLAVAAYMLHRRQRKDRERKAAESAALMAGTSPYGSHPSSYGGHDSFNAYFAPHPMQEMAGDRDPGELQGEHKEPERHELPGTELRPTSILKKAVKIATGDAGR
ncbi:hypothetical protein B9Z65_3677 [Elsinoe australis]|uniref:Peptidase A1 domain-containing protein n=1 Tax=Elsinoe australis TaxID=40998 RepID=A0A2P8AFW8_9PEZI|nr:hypothetical protein B9Z65_3677 [Elsinoe australis]